MLAISLQAGSWNFDRKDETTKTITETVMKASNQKKRTEKIARILTIFLNTIPTFKVLFQTSLRFFLFGNELLEKFLGKFGSRSFPRQAKSQ